LPKSNTGYWLPKLARNVERDKQNLRALREAGWSVLVIWDCELGRADAVEQRLRKFFDA
jgi:DNA mismatch endonuclease (patch repair protein)